jgi:hypothetical protein
MVQRTSHSEEKGAQRREGCTDLVLAVERPQGLLEAIEGLQNILPAAAFVIFPPVTSVLHS